MWARETNFDDAIADASARYNVPVSLIKATIGTESGFNPDAMNYGDPGYAWGLMQMIPSTAKGLGYDGDMAELLTNTGLAISLGAQLLGQNLARTGSIEDSVSAYNGGFRPLQGYGNKRPDGTYANQDYVNRVLQVKAYFDGESGLAGLSALGLGLMLIAGWFLFKSRG